MNGKHTLVFALVGFLCVGVSAFAMQVVWKGTDGGSQLTLGNAQLPTGSLLLLGSFGTMTDSAIAALGANRTALFAAFSTWDSCAIDSYGVFATAAGPRPGGGLLGKQAYLMACNSPNPFAATDVGVFKGPSSNPSIGDPWVFPATDGDVAPAFSLDAITPSGVIIGSWHSFYSPVFMITVNGLDIRPVPEPSTGMLASIGLACCAAVFRRRR